MKVITHNTMTVIKKKHFCCSFLRTMDILSKWGQISFVFIQEIY